MKLNNEKDLLNLEFRKSIIDEIEGPENIGRKKESYKRWEIYRDRMRKYILDALALELDPATVQEMNQIISSINIYKKMVTKKGRVYKDSPDRRAFDEKGSTKVQDFIDSMASWLGLNAAMKQTNRYVEAFRNALVYVKPYIDHEKFQKYNIKLETLAPHRFDAIEDSQNPEILRAVILSPFSQVGSVNDNDPQNRNGSASNNFRDGDGVNQTIADSPSDDKKEYVWWSNSYHFTTNRNGEIISLNSDGEHLIENPIKELPFVSFAKDQDGAFWSVGGEDMIDGSILVNKLLTDLYFIAKIQGMGLFYMFGKNVPKTFKVGPNRAVTMEVSEGDPTPQIGFASSNPPIAAHMAMIEQYIALLLTTNDLGIGSVQGKLGASGAASGIHEIIQNSEPMSAIEDEQQQYQDKENDIIRKGAKWIEAYKGSKTGIVNELDSLDLVNDPVYALRFIKPIHFSNENERLDATKKKMDMGVANLVDAYIAENPDTSREDAVDALKKKAEEKLALMQKGLNDVITEMMDDGSNDKNVDKLNGNGNQRSTKE